MELQKRKPNRLPEYNYSQPGYYFITVCTHDMRTDFGEIDKSIFTPSSIGKIIHNNWQRIPQYFPSISLDVFQLMPNHIHGILCIDPNRELNTSTKRQNMIVPQAVGGFKRFSTLEIRKNNSPDFRWQRSYYDHAIRNERSLERIREYILLNPDNWERDRNIIDDNPFNM